MFICCLQQLDRQLVECVPPAESRLQEWGRVECFDQHCLVAAKWYDSEWPRQVYIKEELLLDVFEEEEEANLCPKDTYWDTLTKGPTQMVYVSIISIIVFSFLRICHLISFYRRVLGRAGPRGTLDLRSQGRGSGRLV